jgi:putative ABC transport system substrate-binding protein
VDRRRFLLTSLAGLLTAPLSSLAQQVRPTSRLGILVSGSGKSSPDLPELNAFTKQLADLGWSEGQNLAVDRRSGATLSQLRGLAAELVRLNANVILAVGPTATDAARAATTSIPIVMIAGADPSTYGITKQSRPAENVTGLTIGTPGVVASKRLEILRQLFPGLTLLAIIWDVPQTADAPSLRALSSSAQSMGLRLYDIDVRGVDDFERVFQTARKSNAQAALIMESPRAVASRVIVAAMALKHRVPLMSQFSRIVEAGGFMSYGPDLDDLFRRAAAHADKILRGARPADVPVEEPVKYVFVVNAKTAKALGLTIPPSLLARADQVIE